MDHDRNADQKPKVDFNRLTKRQQLLLSDLLLLGLDRELLVAKETVKEVELQALNARPRLPDRD